MAKTLSQWLEYIEALHPAEIEMGLERIKKVYNDLPQLPSHATIVTVAGTNGKGSTVRSLEALGTAYGKRVGAYTSPHLLQYNERVRIDQRPVADDALITAFEKVEVARSDTELTYFEFGTLAALVILAEADLDWVLLEVGLGGRLDAVNIIDPSVAVITSVDLDHESWLGDTRDAIGAEKAGIIRADAIFICGDPEPPSSVIEKGKTAKQAFWRDQDFAVVSEPVNTANTVLQWNQSGKRHSLQVPQDLPILPDNLVTALQVASALGVLVDQAHIDETVKVMSLSGRQQLIQSSPYVVLDVGHNPQAARSLAKRLQTLKNQHNLARCHCLIGMLGDKKHGNTLAELLPVVDTWWVTALDAGSRSLPANTLADTLYQAGAVVGGTFMRPRTGYQKVLENMSSNELLVVFGSFYTVADVLADT